MIASAKRSAGAVHQPIDLLERYSRRADELDIEATLGGLGAQLVAISP